MATLSPFRALRPKSSEASRIAAVPYDVVSTDEARALADGNPVSFLRVSRAEIELPSDVNPYDAAVYDRAARNFKTLRQTALVLEDERSVYVYRLRMAATPRSASAPGFLSNNTSAAWSRKPSRPGATRKTTGRATRVR